MSKLYNLLFYGLHIEREFLIQMTFVFLICFVVVDCCVMFPSTIKVESPFGFVKLLPSPTRGTLYKTNIITKEKTTHIHSLH
jgi:hypothetical protein